MLIIISDLHLTDGTSGETIRTNAFGAFRERLRDLAYDASWRRDGKYRPVEEVDIILLGDILDIIRSTKWLTIEERPWSDPHSQNFTAKIAEINSGILERNNTTLGILKSVSRGSAVTLPPATEAGKPAFTSRDKRGSADRVPVKVRMGSAKWAASDERCGCSNRNRRKIGIECWRERAARERTLHHCIQVCVASSRGDTVSQIQFKFHLRPHGTIGA